MKKIVTLLYLVILSSFTFGQTEINYTVSTSGNCFPLIAQINVSTNHPTADMYYISINGSFWQQYHISNPHGFVANSPNNSIYIGLYALNQSTGYYEEVAVLNEAITIPGNTYSLSASGSMPFVTGVGVPFPIELITNDANITSIEWDFGNGQLQNGATSVNPTYNTAGFYLVSCTIESADCGTVVRYLELYVSEIETIFPSNICVGKNFTLTFTGMHPSTVSYFYTWSGGSESSNSNQVNLNFWEQGPAFISINCYDGVGNLVDLMTFEFEVTGEFYEITPSWSFIKLGETVEFTLQTESGNPLDATGISWSVGGSTPSVSAPIDNAGYQTISVSYINACTLDQETLEAYIYAVDGQVTVDTEACAPAVFTITYSGDVIAGITGMYLVEEDEWFDGVSTFDFNFAQAGTYNIEVYFGTGDGVLDLTYQIYIQGPTVSSASVTACGSYQFGPDLLTESGSYSQTYQTATGCDSTVNLTLTIISEVTAAISFNQGVLTATGGDSYQWFDCTTGEYIEGATSSTYAPQQTGLYGVVAYLGDCSDSTEVCFEVTSLNLQESQESMVRVYPNPSNGLVHIAHATGANCMIYDSKGKLVFNESLLNEFTSLDFAHFEAGIYIVHLIHENGSNSQHRLVLMK